MADLTGSAGVRLGRDREHQMQMSRIKGRVYPGMAGAALALFLFGTVLPRASTAADATTLCERCRTSVVTLFSVDPRFKWPGYQGSGFLISDDGILVTARHVAEAEAGLFAVTADGKKLRVTGFIGEDLDYDISVLRLEGSHWAHLPLAASPLPDTNQPVTVISPEPDGGWLCSTGAVRSIPALQNVWEVICTTIPAHGGQSGSPLVDDTGTVVGVVSGLDENERASAMPVKIVREILQRAGSAVVPFDQRPRKHGADALVLDKDFRSAIAAIDRGEWQGGRRGFKRLAKRFPESPLALMLLAVSAIKCQAWKEADAALGKVVGLKPASGMGWYLYGASSAARSRFDQAEAAFRKSIELGFPDRQQLASAWTLIAVGHARKNDPNGVKDALLQLQGLDPAQAQACARQLHHDFPKLPLPSGMTDTGP